MEIVFGILLAGVFSCATIWANECETLVQKVRQTDQECSQYKTAGKNVLYKRCRVRQNCLQKEKTWACSQSSESVTSPRPDESISNMDSVDRTNTVKVMNSSSSGYAAIPSPPENSDSAGLPQNILLSDFTPKESDASDQVKKNLFCPEDCIEDNSDQRDFCHRNPIDYTDCPKPSRQETADGSYMIRCTYNMQDAPLCSETHFNADGEPIGTAHLYYPSGSIWQEISYKNGLIQGTVQEYYESGLLKSETPYQKGLRSGIQKNYMDTDYSETEYNLAIGLGAMFGGDYERMKTQEICLLKYKRKKLLESETHYKDGKRSGVRNTFFHPCDGRGGKVQKTEPYQDDLLEGTVLEFYPGGKRKSIVEYRKGVATSMKICYDKTGKISKRGTPDIECPR